MLDVQTYLVANVWIINDRLFIAKLDQVKKFHDEYTRTLKILRKQHEGIGIR